MTELNIGNIDEAIAKLKPVMRMGRGQGGEYGIFAPLPKDYKEILPFINNELEFRMELFNAVKDHIHSTHGDLTFWISIQFSAATIRLSMEDMAFLMIDPYGLDYGFHGQEIESENREKVLFECLEIILPILHKRVKKLLEEHLDISSLTRITGEAFTGSIEVPISR